MKNVFVTNFALAPTATPQKDAAKGERRPRSAKMDSFLAKANGSTRYSAVNAAACVGEALAKSKKVG
jgi:hypothetical protein